MLTKSCAQCLKIISLENRESLHTFFLINSTIFFSRQKWPKLRKFKNLRITICCKNETILVIFKQYELLFNCSAILIYRALKWWRVEKWPQVVNNTKVRRCFHELKYTLHVQLHYTIAGLIREYTWLSWLQNRVHMTAGVQNNSGVHRSLIYSTQCLKMPAKFVLHLQFEFSRQNQYKNSHIQF